MIRPEKPASPWRITVGAPLRRPIRLAARLFSNHSGRRFLLDSQGSVCSAGGAAGAENTRPVTEMPTAYRLNPPGAIQYFRHLPQDQFTRTGMDAATNRGHGPSPCGNHFDLDCPVDLHHFAEGKEVFTWVQILLEKNSLFRANIRCWPILRPNVRAKATQILPEQVRKV